MLNPSEQELDLLKTYVADEKDQEIEVRLIRGEIFCFARIRSAKQLQQFQKTIARSVHGKRPNVVEYQIQALSKAMTRWKRPKQGGEEDEYEEFPPLSLSAWKQLAEGNGVLFEGIVRQFDQLQEAGNLSDFQEEVEEKKDSSSETPTDTI